MYTKPDVISVEMQFKAELAGRLLAHGRNTTQEVAEIMGVSKRTIRHYICLLEQVDKKLYLEVKEELKWTRLLNLVR